MTENYTDNTIRYDYPLMIVEDFQTFLDYLQKNKIKLTKAKQYIIRKDLAALYAQMTNPVLEVSERSDQTAYPLLHLFFHLALKLDLVRKRGFGKEMILEGNEPLISEYYELTLIEQYVTLLECFWTNADWRELQGGYFGRPPENIHVVFDNLEQFPANQVIKVDFVLNRKIYYYEHFLYYFIYFGFWKITFDDEKRKRYSVNHHAAKTIELTPFFKHIEAALYDTWELYENESFSAMEDIFELFVPSLRYDDEYEDEELVDEDEIGNEFKDDDEENEEIESLFELLKPLFPQGELNKTLNNREETIVQGRYLFKVILSPHCWRTVKLSDTHTLYDFHELIQKAFEFDDDHLYSFFMDGKRYSKNHFNSPMDNRGPFVTDVKIGSLRLFEGQRILYVFDFGADWEFTIDVLKITEGAPERPASICVSKGKAPSQYHY